MTLFVQNTIVKIGTENGLCKLAPRSLSAKNTGERLIQITTMAPPNNP